MPIEQSRDSKQFAAFELSGWDTNIGGYDSAFGAVTRQTVASMLDAARVTPGMEVLDICCGPGMLAAGALERGAEAIGIDFSVEAVKLARGLVVCTENLDSDVLMMQSADHGVRRDASDLLNRAGDRRIVVQ
jgi:2-polyprenyl-3-methyl-5-hydroxy-6-metoxy-1,4-benzoquinol methylase